MLRHNPITQSRLAELWRATPAEIEADTAPLLQNGYISRVTQRGETTYDLGTAFIPVVPWPAEEVRHLLAILAQVWPRYGQPPEELVSALGGPRPARPAASRLIKGPRLFANRLVQDRMAKLEEAVRTACRVRLRHRRSVKDEVVEPLGLVYYWVTDAWYLVVASGQQKPRVLRVDRIGRFRVLTERFAYPCEFDLEQHFRFSWGIETGPLYQLRVRFYDEAVA